MAFRLFSSDSLPESDITAFGSGTDFRSIHTTTEVDVNEPVFDATPLTESEDEDHEDEPLVFMPGTQAPPSSPADPDHTVQAIVVSVDDETSSESSKDDDDFKSDEDSSEDGLTLDISFYRNHANSRAFSIVETPRDQEPSEADGVCLETPSLSSPDDVHSDALSDSSLGEGSEEIVIYLETDPPYWKGIFRFLALDIIHGDNVPLISDYCTITEGADDEFFFGSVYGNVRPFLDDDIIIECRDNVNLACDPCFEVVLPGYYTFTIKRSQLMRSAELSDFFYSDAYVEGAAMKLTFHLDPKAAWGIVSTYLVWEPDTYTKDNIIHRLTLRSSMQTRWIILIRTYKLARSLSLLSLVEALFDVLLSCEQRLLPHHLVPLARIVFGKGQGYEKITVLQNWVIKHLRSSLEGHRIFKHLYKSDDFMDVLRSPDTTDTLREAWMKIQELKKIEIDGIRVLGRPTSSLAGLELLDMLDSLVMKETHRRALQDENAGQDVSPKNNDATRVGEVVVGHDHLSARGQDTSGDSSQQTLPRVSYKAATLCGLDDNFSERLAAESRPMGPVQPLSTGKALPKVPDPAQEGPRGVVVPPGFNDPPPNIWGLPCLGLAGSPENEPVGGDGPSEPGPSPGAQDPLTHQPRPTLDPNGKARAVLGINSASPVKKGMKKSASMMIFGMLTGMKGKEPDKH